MSIQSNELVWKKSENVSDTPSNGGEMGTVTSVSGAKNNIWPDVPQAERTAGSTKYRKMFIHNTNVEDPGDNTGLGLTLISPRLYVETRTPGDDSVNIFLGTQTDAESAITGSERLYGMGVLQATVGSGVTQIVVTVEDWASFPIFANGDVIRISDKADINDGGGNEEYVTLTAVPSPSGDNITLQFTPALANGYDVAGQGAGVTKISSVIQPSDVQCTVDGFANNGSGTFVIGGIDTHNLGTVEEDWTLTFDTATTYTVRDGGAVSVGSGNVSSDFSPTNPNGGVYFTLRSADFGGTFVAAETIDFTTHPAALPVWYRRDVPAGATSLSGNSVIVAVDGESS